jgi:hypothetical protein
VLYGTENLTIKARDAGRITAAGMEYMRKAAGYTRTVYDKEIKYNASFGRNAGLQKKLKRQANRRPCNRLCRIIRNTAYQKAEGTREGYWRGFWMSVTGMGQQLAQLYDSYMVVVAVALATTMRLLSVTVYLITLESRCLSVLTQYTTR